MRLAGAALVLLCGILSACRTSNQTGAPEPGSDLFALNPERIIEVVFTMPDHRLYAWRWTAAERFRLVVAARGAAQAKQCEAGPGFDRWLEAASKMRVIGVLNPPRREDLPDWSVLRIRDATVLDPVDLRLHVPAAAGQRVVVQFEDKQYAVDTDPAVLAMAAGQCADLSSPVPGVRK